MLAKFFHQVFLPAESAHDLECDVLLARGEACQHPVAFTTACTFVVKTAKSNDAGAPHIRLSLCGLFHDLHDFKTVIALSFVLDGIQKIHNACLVQFGFQPSYGDLLSRINQNNSTFVLIDDQYFCTAYRSLFHFDQGAICIAQGIFLEFRLDACLACQFQKFTHIVPS